MSLDELKQNIIFPTIESQRQHLLPAYKQVYDNYQKEKMLVGWGGEIIPLMLEEICKDLFELPQNKPQIPSIKINNNNFELKKFSEQSITDTVNKSKIPQWVKNNAGWWADGQIDNNTFVSGVQFLIKEKIISVSSSQSNSKNNSNDIPVWIKNNADWWAQGLISDDDFIKGIEFLVRNGIIVVSETKEIKPVLEPKTNEFLTYENAGIKIKYPKNWIVDEYPSLVFFSPPESNENLPISVMLTFPVDSSGLTLEGIGKNKNNVIFSNTIFGKYSGITFYDEGMLERQIEGKSFSNLAIVDGKIYAIQFNSEVGSYQKYFDTVQKMFESYEITDYN
ncbi:MAG: hypothetical protein KC444_04070 [Nitrosopumilus sp.]|nr:hypothetical protein [Nitrosopumilus sp.]